MRSSDSSMKNKRRLTRWISFLAALSLLGCASSPPAVVVLDAPIPSDRLIDELLHTGALTPRAAEALRVMVHELSCPTASDFLFDRYYPYLSGLESLEN